jgi:hypothetical protein
MKNAVYQYYKELPSWAKGFIVLFGAAVTYITAARIIKSIKNAKNRKDERKTQSEVKSELNQLQSQGIKKSYPDSQYNAWADKIEKQFDGIDWKQNWFDKDVPIIGQWSGSGKSVAEVFKQLKNNVDFLALVSAYGIRTYDQAGIFTGDFTGNLYQAIQDELDKGEIDALNAVLKKKGITYQV